MAKFYLFSLIDLSPFGIKNLLIFLMVSFLSLFLFLESLHLFLSISLQRWSVQCDSPFSFSLLLSFVYINVHIHTNTSFVPIVNATARRQSSVPAESHVVPLRPLCALRPRETRIEA